MSDASYKRWANTRWWHDGYERLWKDQGTVTPGAAGSSTTEDSTLAAILGSEEVPIADNKEVQQKIIYLTADSEEELTELRPDETYIIGGICDHNRYKVAAFLSLI